MYVTNASYILQALLDTTQTSPGMKMLACLESVCGTPPPPGNRKDDFHASQLSINYYN